MVNKAKKKVQPGPSVVCRTCRKTCKVAVAFAAYDETSGTWKSGWTELAKKKWLCPSCSIKKIANEPEKK